jgi:hypothetical protein
MALTISRLCQLKVHQEFKKPKSQLEYYAENGSPECILRYAGLGGKSFGEEYMEKLAREYFRLSKRSDSGHDHVKMGQSIEQKSARYHSNGNDWKWQHIELGHSWDHLLLTGLDFHEIRFFITPRVTVQNLRELGVLTGQGKNGNPQQAYWFTRTDFQKKGVRFEDYFTELVTEEDLMTYLTRFI